MTERFTIVENDKNYLRIDDKTKEKFYLNEKEIVECLNALYKENEQLKSEIEKITKYKEHWAFISDCSIQVMNEEEKFKEDYLRIATNELKKLQEENEQLKQQLKEKDDFIDEVWRKYEDAHGLSIDNTDWF